MDITPVAVGFDLRRHKLVIQIPVATRSVRFIDGDDTKIAHGTAGQLAAWLAEAGYQAAVMP